MHYQDIVYKIAGYYFQALSLDKDRYLATNKMLNLLILAASTFIVTISTTNSVIPRDMNFKNELKECILCLIKLNDFNMYLL